MQIKDYPAITAISDNDLLLVQTASDGAYKSILASSLKSYFDSGSGSGSSSNGSSSGSDPQFSQVSLLLPFTGSNGSTTFTDICGATTSVYTGNPVISNAHQLFGQNSLYLDGASSVQVADSGKFSMSGSDFTVECWIYQTVGGVFTVADKSGQAYVSYPHWELNSAPGLVVGIENTAAIASSPSPSSSTPLNQWVHIAACKSGGIFYVFMNGVLVSQFTPGFTPVDRSFPLIIGNQSGQSGYFNGYISNFRITNGYARYSSNFSPPTAAFPTK